MEYLGNLPAPQLVEAIARMGLKEAVDRNTDTQKEIVDGLARICEAINKLTESLDKK